MLEDFRLMVFMTVAVERSFTKAANVLGISQPAVSQNVSELEKNLNVKLFDRLRGEVVITPQGRIFHKYVLKILSSYDEVNRLFCNSRVNDYPDGSPVRLYMSSLLEEYLLGAVLECVGTLRPSLAVEVVEEAEDADVQVLAVTEKKDTDLSVRVSVRSDDILLESFFRQVVDCCL